MLIWIDLSFFFFIPLLIFLISRNQNSARARHFYSQRREEASRGLSQEKNKNTDWICFLLSGKQDVKRLSELCRQVSL